MYFEDIILYTMCCINKKNHHIMCIRCFLNQNIKYRKDYRKHISSIFFRKMFSEHSFVHMCLKWKYICMEGYTRCIMKGDFLYIFCRKCGILRICQILENNYVQDILINIYIQFLINMCFIHIVYIFSHFRYIFYMERYIFGMYRLFSLNIHLQGMNLDIWDFSYFIIQILIGILYIKQRCILSRKNDIFHKFGYSGNIIMDNYLGKKQFLYLKNSLNYKMSIHFGKDHCIFCMKYDSLNMYYLICSNFQEDIRTHRHLMKG